MRDFKGLNIDASINHGKLIFKESWLDKFDAMTIYFYFGWAAIIPFLIYIDPHRNKNEAPSFFYLEFLMSFFSIYVIYRKATEKKLIRVLSSYGQEQSRKLINEYCTKEKFEKHIDANNVIIYNENAEFNFITPNYNISYFFFFRENIVLFAIIREGYKLNLPTLIKHLSLKRDLRKMLNNKLG